MELTGGPFMALVAVLAVAAPVVTVVLWSRVRGVAGLRVAQRLGLLVTCQITAVVLTAVLVNDQFELYGSWDDLVGGDAAQDAQVRQPDGAVPAGGAAGATAAGAAGASATGAAADGASSSPFRPVEGGGRVLAARARGTASGVTSRLWVLLPPGYDDPANATTRYPVVEFLPGYPGTPTTWLHALDLQHVMDREVAAGRVRPFIGVLPTMNVAAPRDTECADVAGGGPKVATWLGQDVPQLVQTHLRTVPPGAGWAVSGYSTGGFCAAKLVLTYPQTFGGAAVLAGYFSPSQDVTTGDLYGGSTALRQQNDPLWLVEHRPAPPVRMLAVWSAQDPETAGPTQRFLAAARPPLHVAEIRLAKGGHNTGVWSGVLPQVLRWLSTGWTP